MAEATIPVDLHNPGQVFACLGLMEVAEVLLNEAEGGFNWTDGARATFTLHACGQQSPVEAVLEFLVKAKVRVIYPKDIPGPWPRNANPSIEFPSQLSELRSSNGKNYSASSLPIFITDGKIDLRITNWLEGGGRSALKLFAGKQIGFQPASNMLDGDPQKGGTIGHKQIFPLLRANGFSNPFDEIGPVGGRFGYDARGAWDALRVGTSLDKQGVYVQISPCVEILAAIGLEHARPRFLSTYEIRYGAWDLCVPISLARLGLAAPDIFLLKGRCRYFRANLGDDQQYKKCFPAQEEPYA